MTQGAPRTNAAVTTGKVIDIDALLARRFNTPVSMKIGGKTFAFRRDLTPEQVLKFWQHATKSENVESLKIVLVKGTEAQAKAFDAMIQALPVEVGVEVFQRMMLACGLSRTAQDMAAVELGEQAEDAEGNSPAS